VLRPQVSDSVIDPGIPPWCWRARRPPSKTGPLGPWIALRVLHNAYLLTPCPPGAYGSDEMMKQVVYRSNWSGAWGRQLTGPQRITLKNFVTDKLNGALTSGRGH